MANDITLPGSGKVVKTREADGGHYQKSDLTRDFVFFSPTITVSTSGYAENDCVGGLLTMTNAARQSGGFVQVHSVQLLDKEGLTTSHNHRLFFFNDTVSATNSAVFSVLTNFSKLVGYYSGSSGIAYPNDDWFIYTNIESEVQSGNVWFPIKSLTGTSLYAVLLHDGGNQFGTTDDLEIVIGVERF